MHNSSTKSPAVKKSLKTTGNPNPSLQRGETEKSSDLSKVTQQKSASV